MATSDHPSSTDLLLWLSKELVSERTDEIRDHLQDCEHCQKTITEIESLYAGLARVDEQAAQYRIREALERRHRPFWKVIPIRPKWTVVITSTVIAALLLVAVTEYAPSARAEVLLSRAASAEKAQRSRTLRIEASGMGCSVVIHDAAAMVSTAGSDQTFCRRLASHLQAAGWGWNDLLSARSFKQWRDGLHDKQDSIRKLADTTEVVTRTNEGPLHSAVLRVRSKDYRPVEARFQFAAESGEEAPEFAVTEREEVPREPEHVAAQPPVSPRPEAAVAPSTVVDPVDKTESDVRLALHRLGLDTNVLLAVKREPGDIEIAGVVPDKELAESLAHSLAGLDHVETHVDIEGNGGSSSTWRAFQGDSPPLAYDKINTLFAEDPEERQKFINRVDMLTQRLVAEARTRDGLLVLIKRLRSRNEDILLHNALAETESSITADLGSLASTLEPVSGPLKTHGTYLTAAAANELFQVTHELVFRSKSDSPLSLEESLVRVHRLMSGE